jgi:ribosomal protein S13
LWGFGNFYLNVLSYRLESKLDLNIKDIDGSYWYTTINYLIKSVPRKSSLKRRFLLNLVLLDILTCYRGWRHYKDQSVSSNHFAVAILYL